MTRALSILLISIACFVTLATPAAAECPKGVKGVTSVAFKGKTLKAGTKLKDVVLTFKDAFRWNEELLSSDGMLASLIDEQSHTVILLLFTNPKKGDASYPVANYTLACISPQ